MFRSNYCVSVSGDSLRKNSSPSHALLRAVVPESMFSIILFLIDSLGSTSNESERNKIDDYQEIYKILSLGTDFDYSHCWNLNKSL